MKEFEYFKVNSIEELKQAYYMFEDRWDETYSLKDEIIYFNAGCRYIKCYDFKIFLADDRIDELTEIKSPVRNINNLNKLI